MPVLVEESLLIPAEAHCLDGFRRWAQTEDFPEHGRIDFLNGDIEVEASLRGIVDRSIERLVVRHAQGLRQVGVELAGLEAAEVDRVPEAPGDLAAQLVAAFRGEGDPDDGPCLFNATDQAKGFSTATLQSSK